MENNNHPTYGNGKIYYLEIPSIKYFLAIKKQLFRNLSFIIHKFYLYLS